MTDKKIIIDVTQCPYYREGKLCVYLSYKTKCEGNCNWTSYKEMEEQLDQLKAENDELKSLLKVRIEDLCDSCGASSMKLMPCKVYEKTLTEIKPILEYYANSTIGEEQEDGTYRIELSYKYGSSNMYGAPCYYKYNPKPARQALQKISECEGNNGK